MAKKEAVAKKKLKRGFKHCVACGRTIGARSRFCDKKKGGCGAEQPQGGTRQKKEQTPVFGLLDALNFANKVRAFVAGVGGPEKAKAILTNIEQLQAEAGCPLSQAIAAIETQEASMGKAAAG